MRDWTPAVNRQPGFRREWLVKLPRRTTEEEEEEEEEDEQEEEEEEEEKKNKILKKKPAISKENKSW